MIVIKLLIALSSVCERKVFLENIIFFCHICVNFPVRSPIAADKSVGSYDIISKQDAKTGVTREVACVLIYLEYIVTVCVIIGMLDKTDSPSWPASPFDESKFDVAHEAQLL